MTEKEAIEIIQNYINTQFPKDCPKCGRRYNSLREYLQNTTHQGDPISYDAEDGDWKPKKPIGTFSLANCQCGTTLSVDSSEMKLGTMWRLLFWTRVETLKRGMSMRELLSHLRQEIDKKVLNYKEDNF